MPGDDWDSKFQFFSQTSQNELRNLEIQKQKSAGLKSVVNQSQAMAGSQVWS